MSDIILSFGKHRGKKLSEVPSDYVRWLSGQPTIMGKTEIPSAAKAYLSEMATSEVAEKTHRYAAPKTYEDARKLSWMAEKCDDYVSEEAKRVMLAARNPIDKHLKLFDGDDEHEIYVLVYVRDDGTCTQNDLPFTQELAAGGHEATTDERKEAIETLQRHGFPIPEAKVQPAVPAQPAKSREEIQRAGEAKFDENRRRELQRDIQVRDRSRFENAVRLMLTILAEHQGKFTKRCDQQCREALRATTGVMGASTNQRYSDEIIMIALRIAGRDRYIDPSWRSATLDQAVIDAFVEQGKREHWAGASHAS